MSSFLDSTIQRLGYLLSLPERTVRSVAAMAGGVTSLLTDTLFPEAMKGTTLYKVFIGDAQQFLITQIAQVEKETGKVVDERGGASDEAPGSDYAVRKVIGGALETAGLFAFHMSPMWVLAIAGDAAGGTNEFLNRLVVQLKKNGVVPEDTQINDLTDLLVTIQETSRTGAAAVDTPPLSREELGRLSDEMFASYSKAFGQATNLIPRIEDIWGQMERLSRRENISFERLSGILTVDVASWGRTGIGATMAVGQTGLDLFGEKVLESYARTLDGIARQGVSAYLSAHLTPFLSAAAGHFAPGRRTWIESVLGIGKTSTESPTEAEPGVVVKVEVQEGGPVVAANAEANQAPPAERQDNTQEEGGNKPENPSSL